MQARNKTRTLDNIEFLISIGDFKLRLSLPKNTTVQGLLAVVRGYEALHEEYAPQGMHFMGLGAQHPHPLLDYWLSQPQLDFLRFRSKLQLKCLYSSDRRSSQLSVSEWQFLSCLGKGACGEVYLVRSRTSGSVLALKRVRKDSIRDYNALMTQFRERKNMIKLGVNPHTVTLHASFESRAHFNFLIDYCPGGELFFHLQGLAEEGRRLDEHHTRLYFCEILLAMEFLHRKKVLYRDLKPENIFVDLQGHLRIGDFGLSRCDFEEDDFALSVCGSPEYMAPEVLQNRDYNFSADFYSIGALLYELLAGAPPYYGEGSEEEKLRLMKKMDLNLEVTQDLLLRQLLANLLHPDPDQRISNFQQIKNSPWLANVDWKAVESRQFAMPFAPEPTRTYIAAEFLQLQQEVEHMNYHYDDDHFTSDIADAFEFVRPESRKLLGLDQETPALKPLKKLQPKKHCLKKTNLSVALFDREENPTESCSSSEIKTVKSSDGNKENRENRDNQRENRDNQRENRDNQRENRDNQRENLLRRDNSKKALPRQGSQLLLLGKTPTTLHLVPQKSQRVLLTVPAQSHNSSECSRTASRGKDTVRIRISDVREGREKSKGRSREKGLKESSLGKGSMMKKKEEKKTILPTCSYKIKLT